MSFQSCWPTLQQAFRSDAALFHIAWRVDAIVLQVDWRRYSEHLFSSEKKTNSTACSESSVVIETWYTAGLKRHNFGVHVYPGSADTLVRRDGIKNEHSIAYSLSNISAKNYQNQLMRVEVIVCNISVVIFLRHNIVLVPKYMTGLQSWTPDPGLRLHIIR